MAIRLSAPNRKRTRFARQGCHLSKCFDQFSSYPDHGGEPDSLAAEEFKLSETVGNTHREGDLRQWSVEIVTANHSGSAIFPASNVVEGRVSAVGAPYA